MKKSKLAVASFVLSLIPIIIPVLLSLIPLILAGQLSSFFFFVYFSVTIFVTFWLAIPAIALGIIALIKIKRNNNIGGKWLAIAGIIISVALVIFVIRTLII
ncbi:MAG: DUF4190 domain-containing protein [Candidatus Vogelbacteria bacterium]